VLRREDQVVSGDVGDGDAAERDVEEMWPEDPGGPGMLRPHERGEL
jgi:hypothetical protein